MTDFTIIVGTVMGTAQEVAESVMSELHASGYKATIHTEFTPDILRTDSNNMLLVCTSNTGMGDLPENIRSFHQHLTNDFPRIAGKAYGIINLGDSTYPNYAEAGHTIDHALSDIGATPLVDMLIFDASEGNDYPGQSVAWLHELVEKLPKN